MKRLLVLTVVSTLAIGMAGCRCGTRGHAPVTTGPMMPAATYGTPSSPAVTYGNPVAMPPVTAPSSCGPGCTSCGSTPPALSGAQGYAPLPNN